MHELRELREEHGRAALRVDVAEYRRYKELEKRVGGDLEAAVEFFVQNRTQAATVDYLVGEFLEQIELEFRPDGKNMDTRRVQGNMYRTRLGNFAAAFQGVPADRIGVRDCRNWLESLGRTYAPRTVRNYREAVNSFFNRMVTDERLEKNPMARTKPPRLIGEEHGFYTLREALRFFRINQEADPEVCGLVALSAFGFLRTSAALRLRREDVRKNPRGILCPAANQKKGRRYFIQNYPDNLWAWLDWMPDTTFELAEKRFYRRRTKALERAGLEKIANGWRHAAATHHVAWMQSSKGTANLMQHRSEEQLWQTYRGNATERDGRWYFFIVPRG